MKKELIYNKNHSTIMANDIVRGKQDMALQEARILRLLITQIVKKDNDFKTYTANIQSLANFLEINDANLYRDIRNICKNLVSRTVEVSTGNPKEPWKIFNWINHASYNGEGNITLTLSEQMRPFLIGLNKYYTKYKLENVLSMSSFYAIRLYELLKTDEFKGQFEYTYSVRFLREFFKCEKNIQE